MEYRGWSTTFFSRLFATLLLMASPLFAQEITVAVSANFQFAMQEIVQKFETASNIRVKTVVNSSGKLTAQIRSGAPFDLFLSADLTYPQTLFESGDAATAPKVYAYGSLILWTLKNIDLTRGLAALTDEKIHNIAIANPQTAPYGGAAIAALNHAGIYQKIQSKLVFGRNVSQTNQYVFTKAADVGLTAQSVVYLPKMHNVGRWVLVDSSAYEPVAQGAVILNYGEKQHPRETREFLDFLFSKTGRTILKKYGYRTP